MADYPLLVVSTLAKDVKQATNIAPVILMVLTIAGMLATTESFKQMIDELGMVNTLIPAWNTMLNMQEILKLNYGTELPAKIIVIEIDIYMERCI